MAGFFKTLSLLKPKGLKVVGYLCLVRNSVGEGKRNNKFVIFLEFFF